MATLPFGVGIASQYEGSGAFATGINNEITMVDENFTVIDFGGEVLSFTATPNLRDLTVDPISNGGEPDHKDTRSGWTGTIMVARYTNALDLLDAEQESLYHGDNGVIGGRFKKFTITQKVFQEVDETIKIRQFTRCAVRIENGGSWAKESEVNISIGFRASRCIILAA